MIVPPVLMISPKVELVTPRVKVPAAKLSVVPMVKVPSSATTAKESETVNEFAAAAVLIVTV
jgi:hypothetical protein